ncbi:PREDICTED: zinc finger and BTB domain-containing protein 22-like [Cyprinodon variegatus]|uniref:Zinc finger and BTB domain containing 22a n=1 Tax=Cyprinodon variegatus TaxID=28743 RepID=A0A3Q2FZW0_CYPVA|nr:PREDICTED: zinc finger and BTB domain-containing protein 22-like [Cyprinodon variegatus]XP_015239925.1 PREDICTED: zinc finger and BTB domain-containing protein 22-like [Cyprinodon variegatus]XP_015239926.1 PREDICTED: zinc finger and BTB domain-containing protein 22-like [Cyprinodon variegatus]
MDPTCDSVAPPTLTVQVCFPGVRAAVLDNLNRQREEGRLCDLSIQVQGQLFRAHRCVLAASSPYFHDQVLLKNVTTVSLPSVMDPVAFESVLSSAYTGQLSIIQDDIVNYVTVASFLQMWHIVDKCTEILKRPRPSGEAASADDAQPGSVSRQQSPSSTECLYVEREGRRRERKPDALPPLATWRRPQQAMRWSRPRPPSEQNSADSQLDGLPGYGCQEEWITAPAKPDGLGLTGRHHGGVPATEGAKQKVRFQQRGAPQGREGDETQERKRNVRRETEADEGVGDEEAEMKEGFSQMDLRLSDDGADAGRGAGRQSVEVMKDIPDVCGPDAGVPGPSCPAPGRLQFQSGSWSQQEHRRQDGEDEDEEVDLDCFSSYGRDTYDEIEDGTGQVSQRPLLSPDFSLGASDMNWPSTSGGQGGALAPSSSSAACPPPSSPPTPSSSSSVSVSGAAYTGKVHFCHCGKAYTLKSMRDRHVKMQHLNLRPFGCPVCTKSFKMKHHLTKHLKTHGGLRPYECSLCGKKVIWRDSFLRHQARCQRLASSGNNAGAATAADPEDGYGFGFDEVESFVPAGQVKLEEGEFQRDVSDGMGLLSGMELGAQPQNLDPVSHVFKVEAAERFSET